MTSASEERLLEVLGKQLERRRDAFLSRRLFGLVDGPKELRPRMRWFGAVADGGVAAGADHEGVETAVHEVLRRGGRVLVVAQAGGGATGLLVRWADELAQDARTVLRGGGRPRLPVLLDLAERYDETRGDRSGELSTREWVVQTAARTYGVAPRDVDRWLINGRVVLLLDGFHDLGNLSRDLLAVELSELVGPAGNTVVVASRPAEIDALEARLVCEAAVELEALDSARCTALADRLDRAGAAFAQLLQSSEVLRHFCLTPRGVLIAVDAIRHDTDGVLEGGPRRAEQAVFTAGLRSALEPLPRDSRAALTGALRSAARQQRHGRRRPVTEVPDARLVSSPALAVALRLGPVLLTAAMLLVITHTLVRWLFGPVLPWLWTVAIALVAWPLFRLTDDARIFSHTSVKISFAIKNTLHGRGPLFLVLAAAAWITWFLLMKRVGILAELSPTSRLLLLATVATVLTLALLRATIAWKDGGNTVSEEFGGEPPRKLQWCCLSHAAGTSMVFTVFLVLWVAAPVVIISTVANRLTGMAASKTESNLLFDVFHGLGLGRAGPLFPGLDWMGIVTLVAVATAVFAGLLIYRLVLIKLRLTSRALVHQGYPVDRVRWLRRAYSLGLLERRGGIYTFPYPAALDAVLKLSGGRAVHAQKQSFRP